MKKHSGNMPIALFYDSKKQSNNGDDFHCIWQLPPPRNNLFPIWPSNSFLLTWLCLTLAFQAIFWRKNNKYGNNNEITQKKIKHFPVVLQSDCSDGTVVPKKGLPTVWDEDCTGMPTFAPEWLELTEIKENSPILFKICKNIRGPL